MSDYPRVVYHTAIKKPRNVFGRAIDAPPVNTGDAITPGYPEKLHYKTMLCVVYTAGQVDEAASKAEEARLGTEGWVRHPDLLKENYEDTDK